MAEGTMSALESLHDAVADGDVDFLREGVRVLARAVKGAEPTEFTGAPRGDHDPEPGLTRVNGHRHRRRDTHGRARSLAGEAYP